MIPPDFYTAELGYLTVHTRLRESILRDIVRRLIKNDFTLTDTAAWQTEKLTQAGMLYEDILTEIAKLSEKQKDEIRKIFDDAELEIERYAETLSVPSGEIKNLSPAFRKSMNAAFRKTFTSAENLTKTVAVTSQTAYITAADSAHQQVISGAFSYNDAVRNAILSAAQKDLTVVYPSGHTDSLDIAVRRAVITGVNQTGGELADMIGNELGYDLRELTAHVGARPEHAVWQGRIVSLSGRKGYLTLSDIGYGDVRGFLGANCRHNWYPFPEGGTPSYGADELAKMADETVTVGGTKMPMYEAIQKQRAYERAVRKTKRELVVLDEAAKNAKTPEEKANFAAAFESHSVKLKAKENRLAVFCKETGLDRDRTREQMFAVKTENGIRNFGKSTSGKAVWANKRALTRKQENAIIKEIKACGIRGEIILGTDNMDVSSFSFDETHINKERSHNVSRDEAERFIREARFIEIKWNGAFKNYYSTVGASFVDVKNNNIRTAFRSEEYSDSIIKALEVLEKHGR